MLGLPLFLSLLFHSLLNYRKLCNLLLTDLPCEVGFGGVVTWQSNALSTPGCHGYFPDPEHHDLVRSEKDVPLALLSQTNLQANCAAAECHELSRSEKDVPLALLSQTNLLSVLR